MAIDFDQQGLMPEHLARSGASVYGRFVRRLSKRVQDALAKATEVAEESLGNLRTVRAFSKERHEINQYQPLLRCSFFQTIS